MGWTARAPAWRRILPVLLLGLAGCFVPGPDTPSYTLTLHEGEVPPEWPTLTEEDMEAAPELRDAIDIARVEGEAHVEGNRAYDEALILLDNQVGSRSFVFEGRGFVLETGSIR